MIPFMGETVCRAFNFVFISVFLLLLKFSLTIRVYCSFKIKFADKIMFDLRKAA